MDHDATTRGTPPAEPPSRRSGATGERPGDFVGPYKLLERIGEGGFGTVWLAERREPIVQRVALKILNPGMDSREVLARFEQERQALAVMNHPNVAKVIDAGASASGRPYFAMEHVPGEPITDYCDRHRLTIKERLELFIPVCEAVQHAHHKGIIHRDIKPSNILVAVHEGRAVPKVIDFGVAKAVSHTLTQKTIFTEHGRLIGTPEYMSPEQAEMGATDVDTRTDVYALGVVLYELLSGLLPFDSKTLRAAGINAICRIIREQEPPRPSTRLTTVDVDASAALATSRHTQREQLTRELRRELDWIPLKAIRKDRAERYDTPMDLAQDIGRYLKGEALEAGPESAAYRLRKLVRRNKGSVVAFGAVVLALVLGLAGTLWKADEARREATAARAAEAEQGHLRQQADEKTTEAEAARADAERQREAVEHTFYVANIQMAAAAMEFRQFDRVRQRLSACPERLRGWEWRWLNALTDSSLLELKGHQGHATHAAFAPDGRRIVTSSADGTARVWDAVSGQVLVGLLGHTNWVTSAAYSPDGRRIVTSSADGTVRVWESATGASLLEIECHQGMVTFAAFSPDGARIVTSSGLVHVASSFIVGNGYDNTAQVWDATTGEATLQLTGHTGGVQTALFSPDGTLILTASMDGTARIWNATTGESLVELRVPRNGVEFASFSHDGKRVVTASTDKIARVWSTVTGESLVELKGHTTKVLSAAFSPDDSLIVTASTDKTARIWDAATGTSLAELLGHTDRVVSALFSPDGSRVLTASYDDTARVWDAGMREDQTTLKGHSRTASGASFSPDGARIVTASYDNTARVRSTTTGETLITFRGHSSEVNSATFSPDGTRIVTASTDGTAQVWSASTGVRLAKFEWQSADDPSLGRDMMTSAAFSPDGTRIVATLRSNPIAQIWDSVTGVKVAELKGHSDGLESASFSVDGSRIITASRDGTARVWSVTTGTTLTELKGYPGMTICVAFSPDGTRALTTAHEGVFVNAPRGFHMAFEDDIARMWDTVLGASLINFVGHADKVLTARFNPDGTRVVTSSSDRTARVWNAATGECLVELKGHGSWLSSATFSPDGTRIVTTSADHTARVWDSVPYRERFPAIERARVAKAKMAPIVQARLNAGDTVERLRSALNADATLSTDERTAASVEMQSYLDARTETRIEGARLNRMAWEAVTFAEVAPAVALKAVADAKKALELDPGNADFTNTLAVALYRSNNFEESLATLLKAEDLYAKLPDESRRGPHPAQWAFIAMCHQQLNHPAEARAALAKLHELMQDPAHEDDEESKAFLREAVELIEATPAAAK